MCSHCFVCVFFNQRCYRHISRIPRCRGWRLSSPFCREESSAGKKQHQSFIAQFLCSLQKEKCSLIYFSQLKEEIAAKEEDDSNNRPKEKKKNVKDKGTTDIEVQFY